ncbi:uncharacterized protein K452DRAFT_3786 [Aplosporella prunicola CBS 121167]|uniref:Uncharacterized protein n=1 Tax=Aplosporella prunicola CBS 121167 TaxID=1176127 RepID=A0A6A6BSY4_9PEZI|nr:uncharacterized protein K452DRAFT_3786 [Aplosporella prunicola CBS 121167]KAF2147229.1 hypothetical protein K452DRAFT_3786 [Aplosporella prunicola CBS 121167]
MASPQQSITTVDGRRCTRVRRNATTSLLAGAPTSTTPATSTTVVATDGSSSTSFLSQSTSLHSAIAPTADATYSSHSHSAASLSPGAIAGIIIGALVGTAIAALLLFFCVRRRRRSRGFTSQTPSNEKIPGDGNGGLTHPATGTLGGSSFFGALFATFRRPKAVDQGARSTTNSPYIDGRSGGSRFSASSAGSTRHLRSASAPLANQLRSVKDRFRRRLGRARPTSTDSVRSFFTPTPPVLPVLPVQTAEDPFRDPDRSELRITNPDSPGNSVSTKAKTLRSERTPLTPGTPNWRQSTLDFQFPLPAQPKDPFLDPSPNQRQTIRIEDNEIQRESSQLLAPYRNRSQSHATALSHPTSSFYSADGGGLMYTPQASVHISPLKPAANPFDDRNAFDFESLPNPFTLSNLNDGGNGPKSGIPLANAVVINRSSLSRSMSTSSTRSSNPLPTTYSDRSSYFGPGRSGSKSGISSRRATTNNRETRGKSDPFDLDRPDILGVR